MKNLVLTKWNAAVAATKKHLYVWQVLIILLALIGSLFFVFKFMNSRSDERNYLTMNISQVNQYDPYGYTKTPLSFKGTLGLMITLNQKTYDPYLEAILGGRYDISFLNDHKNIGSTMVDATARDETSKEAQIIAVPQAAIDNGYDTLILTPKAGKKLFISYISPLANGNDNKVLQPAETLICKRFSGSQNGYYYQNGTAALVQSFFAYLNKAENGKMTLEFNLLNSELETKLISVENGLGKTIALFDKNTVLPKYTTEQDKNKSFTIPMTDEKFEVYDLYVTYQYVGENEIKKVKVNPIVPINEEIFSDTLIRTRDNLADFSFIDVKDKVVTFKGEKIVLTQPLFIPKGMEFRLTEGQHIDLQNGAFIITRSPIYVDGTADKPVTLTSTDNTLNAGLVVIQAGKRSVINNLICDNLGEVKSGVWKLTGAVTFYESDIDINDSQFLNNRSEDGLNIVRSDMNIVGCTIKNTYQDAFDSDFSTGIFENCHFENTGNDAFDVSTTQVTVKNCTFKNIHDKAISAGERATIIVDGMFAENVQTGIGTKDSSVVTAKNVTVKDALIGFCSYQKKPEFGASQITVDGYEFQGDVDFKYLIEKQDTLIVDGKRWVASNKKKEAMIIDRMINEVPIT